MMSGLLGLMPAYYGGTAVPAEFIERQDGGSASSSDRTITFSASVLEGDGLLLLASAASTLHAPSTPSGFTQLQVTGNGKVALYWKVGGGSESGSYTVSFTGGANTRHQLHGYLIRGGTLSVADSAVASHTNDTSVSCGGTTFSVDKPGSFMLAGVSTTIDTTRTFSFTNSFTRFIGAATQMESAYREYAGTAAGQGTDASWTSGAVTDSALVLIEST